MANFDEDIQRVTKELLEDGTIDKILREKLEAGFSEAIGKAFSWGVLKDAIDKRVKEIMVPFIENYDMSAYLIKLDTVLSDIVNNTGLEDNKKILENFQKLMVVPTEKVITLEDLFHQYKKFVAKEIDTNGRDVNYDDGPHYEPVEVMYEIVSDEDRTYSCFEHKSLDFMISDTEDQADDLGFLISLSRYKNTSDEEGLYEMHYRNDPTVKSLRYLNDFELLLIRLDRAGVKIKLDSKYDDSDSDEVYPDNEPEPTYQ